MAEEEAIRRIMPHNLEAESAVIGSMLMDQEAIQAAAEILTAEDFYSRQYGVMFETICELNRDGMAVDPVTLQNRMHEKNLPPETYSNEVLQAMVAQVTTTANVESYARIVADKAMMRRLVRAGEEMANSAYAEQEPIQTLLEKAEKQVFDLSQKRNASDFLPISEIVVRAINRISEVSKVKGNVTGIASGFHDLDQMTAGFQPSDLILLAARPSMGKTAFVLNVASYVTLRLEKSLAIFSLEMSREQLVNRLFAMESHIDSKKIRTGDLSDTEWGDLITSAGIIGKSRLIIDDTPAISVPELRSRCRRYKVEFGLDMVVIDYLQLMSGSSSRGNDSRQQEVSEISRSLKALARELKVPVIALSQLSRAVESRTDKRPMLSDLRESGAIEQDADIVMFIYRDDYYHPDSDRKGIAEIIVAKQRNGPIGNTELRWIPDLTRFANLEGARTYSGEEG
ncbi:MAG: replicative DNA helicase [Lachnospiraceae bacterium]|nr:replicative DNA helicase [Lachnospiraceae bacterium]